MYYIVHVFWENGSYIHEKAQAQRDLMDLKSDSLLFAYFEKGSLISNRCVTFDHKKYHCNNTNILMHQSVKLASALKLVISW